MNFSRTLTRKQMVALCRPLIERTLELCERCLSTARISRGEVGEVLLVGGQSRMLAVRDAVKDFFAKEPRRDINPDEVVAVGAALYAYSLSADTLQQEAHDAAEDAFEVALRQTEVARKIVNEVEELRARPLDDQGLAARLQTLLQATEADGTIPPEFERGHGSRARSARSRSASPSRRRTTRRASSTDTLAGPRARATAAPRRSPPPKPRPSPPPSRSASAARSR